MLKKQKVAFKYILKRTQEVARQCKRRRLKAEVTCKKKVPNWKIRIQQDHGGRMGVNSVIET